MMKYIVIHCNVYRDFQFVTYIGRGAERFSAQEKKNKSVSVRIPIRVKIDIDLQSATVYFLSVYFLMIVDNSILIRLFNIFLDYSLCKYKRWKLIIQVFNITPQTNYQETTFRFKYRRWIL